MTVPLLYTLAIDMQAAPPAEAVTPYPDRDVTPNRMPLTSGFFHPLQTGSGNIPVDSRNQQNLGSSGGKVGHTHRQLGLWRTGSKQHSQ
ncbi:MAG: hypothetical protein R3E93_04725 [Thiothrix sp.]